MLAQDPVCLVFSLCTILFLPVFPPGLTPALSSAVVFALTLALSLVLPSALPVAPQPLSCVAFFSCFLTCLLPRHLLCFLLPCLLCILLCRVPSFLLSISCPVLPPALFYDFLLSCDLPFALPFTSGPEKALSCKFNYQNIGQKWIFTLSNHSPTF